jgi:hypothetical protein
VDVTPQIDQLSSPELGPRSFRKRPVLVQAMQYNGVNEVDVQAFTGAENFHAVAPEDRLEDPDVTAEVYDKLHSTWVGVKNDQWVIRGVVGEFYPIDPDVLAETYEAA